MEYEFLVGENLVCQEDVVIYNNIKFSKNKSYTVKKAFYINDDLTYIDVNLSKDKLHYFITDNNGNEEYFSGIEIQKYFTTLPEIRKQKINNLNGE